MCCTNVSYGRTEWGLFECVRDLLVHKRILTSQTSETPHNIHQLLSRFLIEAKCHLGHKRHLM
jgi:hypothetical protein